MKVHELNTRPLDVVPDFALSALRRWAREKPLQIALRHRRQGTWKAWRWIDVLREVERCAAGLRQQGFVPEARLVLCGAIEPSLLILAIAAHSLGGYSAVISPQSRGEVLQRQLRLLRPDFAFVQRLAANHLHIEMSHVHDTLAGFAHQGKGLRQQAVQRGAFAQAFAESLGLGRKIRIA